MGGVEWEVCRSVDQYGLYGYDVCRLCADDVLLSPIAKRDRRANVDIRRRSKAT